MPSDLLTAAEVADRLRVSPKTVLRWARTDAIDHVKLPGGHYRFPRAAVEAIAPTTDEVAS